MKVKATFTFHGLDSELCIVLLLTLSNNSLSGPETVPGFLRERCQWAFSSLNILLPSPYLVVDGSKRCVWDDRMLQELPSISIAGRG